MANWYVLKHAKLYGLKVSFPVLIYRSNPMQLYWFCSSNYHLCVVSLESFGLKGSENAALVLTLG